MPLAFLTVGRLRLLGAALPPGEGLAALFRLPLLGADRGMAGQVQAVVQHKGRRLEAWQNIGEELLDRAVPLGRKLLVGAGPLLGLAGQPANLQRSSRDPRSSQGPAEIKLRSS